MAPLARFQRRQQGFNPLPLLLGKFIACHSNSPLLLKYAMASRFVRYVLIRPIFTPSPHHLITSSRHHAITPSPQRRERPQPPARTSRYAIPWPTTRRPPPSPPPSPPARRHPPLARPAPGRQPPLRS